MISAIYNELLFGLPASLACLAFTVEMVALVQAVFWVFERLGARRWLVTNNEVAGIIFGAIALVYSLILAFVIVAVWENYNQLEMTIQTETDRLSSILSHSGALPEQMKKDFGASIINYCDQVVNEDWQMRDTGVSRPSAIPSMRLRLLNVNTENSLQERVFDDLDKDLSAVSDLRRERLAHTHSQMPQLIWQILQAGAVILILFSFFFYVPSVRMKRIYLAFFVSSIAMCMFLIYTLDHPFTGPAGVSDQPYRDVREEVKLFLCPETGVQPGHLN